MAHCKVAHRKMSPLFTNMIYFSYCISSKRVENPWKFLSGPRSSSNSCPRPLKLGLVEGFENKELDLVGLCTFQHMVTYRHCLDRLKSIAD